MAIEISSQDVAAAEQFLASFLEENISEGRFTQGTALRDLAVKAFAYIFAHLKKENTQVRSLQSLLTVQNVATGDVDTDRAVAAGVDAILSNWFIYRHTGQFSRGRLRIKVSRRQDYVIRRNTRFLYDRSHAFYPDVPDTQETIIIPASSVLPNINASGEIEDYAFYLNVVAARTGAGYDVNPSTWVSTGDFSPFVVSVSNEVKFTGGLDRETTEALIDRSASAISVRNLINLRSVDAVLRDKYADISRLLTVGMGDPEMQRDLKLEFASGIEVHVGGHYDVYLELPRTQVTFEGQVGGRFARPDGIANVFRDSTIPDWTSTVVSPGDVIRIASGLPNAPRDFVIKEVLETELRISANTPFAEATEDESAYVDYYIYRPIFTADTQLLPVSGVNTTGQTSRYVQTPARVLLPGGPHYDILEVAVIDPDPSDSFINSGDGFVYFPNRSNVTPAAAAAAEDLEFQLLNSEPATAQSQEAMDELLLESSYNGKTVRVTYETLVGFDAIHQYTRDRFERVLAANILMRGYHPVYLSCTIPYRLKPLASVIIDESSLVDHVVTYINTFNPEDVIDVSDLKEAVRQYSNQIGTVFNFEISYDLMCPDGRVIRFKTPDLVSIDPSYLDASFANNSLPNPQVLSVSDRTVRYLTTKTRIAVEEK